MRTAGLPIFTAVLATCVSAVSAAPRGIVGKPAPKWTVEKWINFPEGGSTLDVGSYRGKVIYLYCFQAWCPGCHARGFPTLQRMIKKYGDNEDMAFVAVQTVFEGFGANTFARAKQIAQKYNLTIPVGQSGEDGRRSELMRRYRTGGTPWTIIIDRKGIVRFNDFYIEDKAAGDLIDRLLREKTRSARQQSANARLPVHSDSWPSFRGNHASGVADRQNLPDAWDGSNGANILWKTKIPGLAHSSPIVWGKQVFVTTAISSQPDATFKPGLYGDGDASSDRSKQRWCVYALDRRTGEIIWQQTAHEGTPRSKRHIKATYANATPVTDGRFIVAFFGSEGLYAYDLSGKLIWTKDVGDLDVGAYDAPSYEWGPASSPIIYHDLVILQCDQQEGSFLLACDIHSGKTVWKTARDELPSWATPTIHEGRDRVELIVNGSNFIRGYNPLTGRELWRLGGSSKITVPTPVIADDLVIVTSGRRPEKPIFALRPGASGDISVSESSPSNDWVVWSKQGRGPYISTPLIYQNYLYACSTRGILDCYDLRTGNEVYRERIPHRGAGFSASPVAADGKIYLPSEDGDVFVIKAGPEFKLLSTNTMGEPLMATPALSRGTMYIRGQHHLFAVGRR